MGRKSFFKKNFLAVLIFFVILIFFFLNIIWIMNANNTLLDEDVYFLSFVDGAFRIPEKAMHFLFFSFYPPVSLFITSFFFLLFGVISDKIYLINVLFLVLSLPLLYRVTRYFFAKKKIYYILPIFLGFPAVVFFIRMYYEQMFLLFFYLLSFYFLFKSNKFKNRKYSVLYGISLGLFALTKYTAFPYILPQFIYIFMLLKEDLKYVFKIFKSKSFLIKFVLFVLFVFFSALFFSVFYVDIYSEKYMPNITIFIFLVSFVILLYLFIRFKKWTKNSKLNNFFDGVSIFFLMSFIWYYPLIFSVFEKYMLQNINPFFPPFLNYIFIFILIHANFPILIISLFLSYFFLSKYKGTEKKVLLISSIVIPYIIFSIFPVKNLQVTFLILVPLSIILTFSLIKIEKRSKLISALILILFMFSGLYYSFPYKLNLDFNLNTKLYGKEVQIPVLSRKNPILYSYRNINSKYLMDNIDYIREITDLVNKSSTTKLVSFNLDRSMADIVFEHYFFSRGYSSIEVRPVEEIFSIVDSFKFDEEKFSANIRNYDLFIIQEGNMTMTYFDRRGYLVEFLFLINFLESNQEFQQVLNITKGNENNEYTTLVYRRIDN